MCFPIQVCFQNWWQKKGKFRERGITPQNINFLAEKEDKKLTQLKLELSKLEIQPAGCDENEDDQEDDDNEEDEYNEYLCAEI